MTISRPDITFDVHKLSQYVTQPHQPHLNTTHHLLHYQKSSPSQGILFSALSSFQLRAFANVDWGACLDSQKSITRFCVFLRDSLIYWKVKKQATASRSSVQAKYRDLRGFSFLLSLLLCILSVESSNGSLRGEFSCEFYKFTKVLVSSVR